MNYSLFLRLALPAIPLLAAAAAALLPAGAGAEPFELHQRLERADAASAAGSPGPLAAPPTVALTLDACGGAYDAELIDFLVRERIAATVFATRKWLNRNPDGLRALLAHPELFEIEDHGADHVPAVIGASRRVYGIRGEPDLDHLKAEVLGGASAVAAATGRVPHWYRGATAVYDPQAVLAIEALGFGVAGFSLNADAGATLHERQIVARVRAAVDGDVIIAHVNRPRGETAEGLSIALADLLRRGYRFVRLQDAQLTAIDPRQMALR